MPRIHSQSSHFSLLSHAPAGFPTASARTSPASLAAASLEPGYPAPAGPAASSSALDGLAFCPCPSPCCCGGAIFGPSSAPGLDSPALVVVAAAATGFGWFLSTCPRSRPGSMTSLTRRFSSFVSGKPPSALRSQRVQAWTVLPGDEDVAVAGEECKISTVNVPPVEGWRATSPRDVENVDRSSWAYCAGC